MNNCEHKNKKVILPIKENIKKGDYNDFFWCDDCKEYVWDSKYFSDNREIRFGVKWNNKSNELITDINRRI